ncbi:ATP binding protein [Dorcoceras hygrometricum]|uniref:ATP binding protein n=1 Tax=Dorcoceras hygrometricum TaxID=472368 RepID=A0A2Z6ZZI4_9LAMI|nr:ATP binding protein [Dorcoceras hygrometricum]
MSNVEQEADNSKRNSEESDVVLKNQQMRFALALKIQQMLFALITSSRKIPAGSLYIQTRATTLYSTSRWEIQSQSFHDQRLDNQLQAIRRNQRSKWKESMAKIKSCKFPQFKGTRFVLFWEIVQFTEEVCTELERRQFGLDKRRTDLEFI